LNEIRGSISAKPEFGSEDALYEFDTSSLLGNPKPPILFYKGNHPITVAQEYFTEHGISDDVLLKKVVRTMRKTINREYVGWGPSYATLFGDIDSEDDVGNEGTNSTGNYQAWGDLSCEGDNTWPRGDPPADLPAEQSADPPAEQSADPPTDLPALYTTVPSIRRVRSAPAFEYERMLKDLPSKLPFRRSTIL